MDDHHADAADLNPKLTATLVGPPPSVWQRLMEDDDWCEPEPASDPQAPPSLVARDQVEKRLGEALRAFRDSQPGSCDLVTVTPGAGKSRTALLLVRLAPEPYVLVAPTHALADEHEKDLLAAAGGVHVRRGITGLRINGQRACLQHARAQALIRAGADPARTICDACPHRERHPLVDGACPAFAARVASSDGARISVVQSARLDAILEDLSRTYFPARRADDESDEPEEGDDAVEAVPPLVIIDEPPGLLVTTRVDSSTLKRVRAHAAALNPSVRGHVERFIGPVLEAIESGDLRDGDCLLDVLGRRLGSGGGTEAVDEVLHAGWHAGSLPLDRAAERQFGESSASDEGRALDDQGQARDLLLLLREAAFAPRRPLVSVQDRDVYFGARAPWVRQLRAWLRRGGRALLLDATGNPSEFRALGIPGRRPGSTVTFRTTEIHVADAPGVQRVFVRWASGAKSRHVVGDRPVAKELQGVLRQLATFVAEHGGPLGLIAHKPVALALKAEFGSLLADPDYKSELVPGELARHVRARVDVRIGWYGAHRGLNTWNGVAVHVTLGDPNPNLGVVRAEATALGWNPEGRSARLREAERNQASGRARPIWGSPKTIVHVGNHKPSTRWAPQWAECATITLEPGRPAKPLPEGLSIAEHETRRAALALGKRAYARLIGAPAATYMRRLNGH